MATAGGVADGPVTTTWTGALGSTSSASKRTEASNAPADKYVWSTS
jgi:hypothetical protein